MKRGHQLRAALVGAALIAAAIPAITAGRPSSSPTAYATPGHAATVRTSTVSTGSTPATVECAGIAAAPPGPPYPIPNQPWTPGLAAAVINSVGVTDFPASYGGMELTGDRDLVIYLAGQDPALVAEVDSLAGRAGVHVTYVGVPYSAGYLGALEECVAGDSPILRGEGLAIEALLGDLVNGVVDVTLETPTNVPSSVRSVLLSPAQVASAQAVLDARYGAGRLVVQSRTMQAPVAIS